MARDRKGAQLSLEVEPQLLERLRARAAADGRPLAALVRRWLEAGLSRCAGAAGRPCWP
jgi:plasmid stability protein